MRRALRFGAVLGVMLCPVVVTSLPARSPDAEVPYWNALHTRLLSSYPADGDTLDAPVEQFHLLFSAPVDASLSSFLLVRPAGDSLRLVPSNHPDSTEVLVADAPSLTAGLHVLHWQSLSRDGHPVKGTITFYVVAGTAEAPPAAAGARTGTDDLVGPAHRSGVPSQGMVRETPGQAPEHGGPGVGGVAVAALALGSLLAFAGLLWLSGSGVLLHEPRVRRTAIVAGVGAVLLLTLDGGLWLLEVRPPGASGLEGFRAAVGTRTGEVAVIRTALALVAVLTLGVARRGQAAAVLAMLAVVVGGASGHSATIRPLVAIPANGLHLGGAAVWLGALLLLVVCPGRPTHEGGGREEPEQAAPEVPGWTYRDVAGIVSGAALLSVLLVAGSGIVQLSLYVPDLGSLVASGYGRLALTKVAGLGALVLFGAHHRFRLLPRLENGSGGVGEEALRRSVRLEMAVMLLVVLAAAWLARVTPPGAL